MNLPRHRLSLPPIFPPFEPSADGHPVHDATLWLSKTAKRVLPILAFLSVLGGGLTALGFHLVTPQAQASNIEDRMKRGDDSLWSAIHLIRDTLTSHAVKLDSALAMGHSTVYIGCQTLYLLQPQAVQPETCVSEPRPRPRLHNNNH